MTLDFGTIAHIFASRGLNAVLEGVLLTGLSWGVLRCFGARSSVTRFAVWFSTLLVIALLPLLSFGSHGVSRTHAVGLTLSPTWASALFAAWAVMASLLVLRLLFSLWRVWRFRLSCVEVGAECDPALLNVISELSSSQRVKVLVSDEIRTPAAVGFFAPAVLLPSWSLQELSSEELKVILLHELAHLKRRDLWTNLAQKLIKAVFFFHPAVWWIDRRLALEREIACDDMVLAQTSDAKGYAESLVSIAERVFAKKSRVGKTFAMAQAALGRVHEISDRLAQILDNRPRANRGMRRAVAMAATVAIVAIAAMPFTPELVSFREQGPISTVASTGIGSSAPKAIQASWTDQDSQLLRLRPAREQAKVTNRSRRNFVAPSTEAARTKRRMYIPAKAESHSQQELPKLVKTSAPTFEVPTETLLIFRTTQFDESGMPILRIAVWQFTTQGDRKTVQETVILDSI